MAEKPIPLYQWEVKAIRDGRKSQTRRIVRPQPEGQLRYCFAGSHKKDIGKWHHGGKRYTPPCRTGDILWVRETWNNLPDDDGDNYVYKADGGWDELSWKPSIHMSREAARLFLEVTEVRVERLQDITEEDAMAEGADLSFGASDQRVCKWQRYHDAFHALWDSIYSKRGHGWEVNDWVWVITFKRIGADTK